MPAHDRKRILQPLIERVYQAEEELALLQTLDNGTPYRFSRHSRLSGKAAADILDHYAGWCDKITGETYPQFTAEANLQYLSFREPIGVAAAIIAFNAPLAMFATKVGAALASGCTIVVKPSEYTNIAVSRMAEIFADSDLPPGVFNFITGGSRAGAALSSHPDVDKVSFTGSASVGEQILASSGQNMKRVSLELGGKSAGIVFDDARSIEVAAKSLMGLCSTFLSGQICSTPSRAIVHRSKIDEFVNFCSEQVKTVKFGDPFDASTNTAPIISEKQVNRILNYIDSGRSEGATLCFGGDRPGGELENGNWINPALFVDVKNDMRIAREEIFGPVLCVIPFDTEEEAVAIANDSEYGLAGCIYTADVSKAFRVARAVRSGSVGINGYASSPHSPMGGIRRSGIGREGGWAAIDAFTEIKTVVLNMDG
ncbi:aldehyde dehydrogenase family protein [Kineobactrum salinum]|uniref:aldehyde dehydrogenase family protein n=1 Tax=Kineobactrum salinum TaxID=2708301 RepID=UPI0018D81D7A|nr:aldehyde dehydrogenase family protein [Kineobactrum salinum]